MKSNFIFQLLHSALWAVTVGSLRETNSDRHMPSFVSWLWWDERLFSRQWWISLWLVSITYIYMSIMKWFFKNLFSFGNHIQFMFWKIVAFNLSIVRFGTANELQVMTSKSGFFYPVCAQGWNKNIADQTCQQLGFRQ